MKLNLLTVTSLLCGLLFLGSCAKDEPQANPKKEQANDGSTVSIPLEMDIAVAAFNEPEPKAQNGRALPKTPVTVKEGNKAELNDDLEDTAEKQRILSVMRSEFVKNNKTIDVVMHFECNSQEANVSTQMHYDADLDHYSFGGDINLPTALVTAMGSANAKVTIYTGGSSYDASNERFTVEPVMKEVSLSTLASTPIDLPILYASTAAKLKIKNGKLVPVSNDPILLKPQGSLLLVTFRNNMDQDVTFDGITAVSNNYFGPNDQSKLTYLKIKGQRNSATELTTEAPAYTSPYNTAVYGGKAYTYFAKDFSSAQSTVAKGGAIADKAFIFWGIKGDAVAVSPPSANGLGDNGYLVNPSTGLIHVYAQNAQIGGRPITHPNYSVAPIGGAHFSPETGKAYTLNCEFYTQPRQALGYLDKGYLYKDGTWKHHDVNAGGLTNDPQHYNSPTLRNVPLVSSAEAREVLDGNVTTSKGKMYVPNQAWLNLMSLLYPIEFSQASGVSRFKDFKDHFAKGASGYDYRAYIYKELLPYKSVNDDTSEFSEGQFICADYARKDQGAADGAVGYAYRHLYIAPRKATGAQPRSKYQTLVRCLTRSKVVDSSPYVTSIVMESVYLGKYFVGTLVTTPLYVERNATKPFTYLQESSLFGVGAEPTRGMVTRILINANEVRGVFKDDKYLKPYSEVKNFATATGIKLLHWGTVPGQWEYEAMQIGNDETRLKKLIEEVNKVSRAPILNRFYGYNSFKGGIYYSRNGGGASDDVRGLFSDNTYQPMRAYSTTYQGDDGKKPEQGL